jgi:hypothetical protein
LPVVHAHGIAEQFPRQEERAGWFVVAALRQQTICRESDFWRERLAKLDDFIQDVAEIVNSLQGDDDGVAATTVNRFGDPQERPLRILFQVKCELLPLDADIDTVEARIHSV